MENTILLDNRCTFAECMDVSIKIHCSIHKDCGKDIGAKVSAKGTTNQDIYEIRRFLREMSDAIVAHNNKPRCASCLKSDTETVFDPFKEVIVTEDGFSRDYHGLNFGDKVLHLEGDDSITYVPKSHKTKKWEEGTTDNDFEYKEVKGDGSEK